jgi:hypothetical protein
VSYNELMAKSSDLVTKLESFTGGIDFRAPVSDTSSNRLVTYDSSAGVLSHNVVPVDQGRSLAADLGSLEVPITAGSYLFASNILPPQYIMPIRGMNAGSGFTSDWAAIAWPMGANLGSGVQILWNDAAAGAVQYKLTADLIPIGSSKGIGNIGMEVATDTGGTLYLWYAGEGNTPAYKKILLSSAFTVATATGPGALISILKVWKARMCAAGPGLKNRLFFSDINNPESWPVNNFIDIKSVDDEGESITNLGIVAENLVVFKERSIWIVYDSVTFENRRIANIGCLPNQGFVGNFEERIYWVDSTSGVYSSDGDSVRFESPALEPLFKQAAYTDILEWGYYANIVGPRYTFAIPGSMLITQDGRIILTFGGQSAASPNPFVFVGYLKQRDPKTGEIPWYLLGGTRTPHAQICSTVELELPTDTRLTYPTTGPGLALMGMCNGNGRAWLSRLEMQGRTKDTVNAVDSVIPWKAMVGPIRAEDTEEFIRMRKLDFVADGKASVDIYKDMPTNAPMSIGPTQTSNSFLRFRPELRARSFLISVKNPNTLTDTFRMSNVEAKLRRAGL